MTLCAFNPLYPGGQTVGIPQEQAQDELREAVARTALLLRQEHHPEDGGQEIRIQVLGMDILASCPNKYPLCRFVCDMQSILGQTPAQFFERVGVIPQGTTEDD